jgi:Anti-sigma-K factor rskA/Putative zinc-finger
MTAGNHGTHGDDHVFDELPALLNGELGRAETSRVSDHLRACDDCRQDLVLAVSASAALRSAVRFAPTVMEEDGGLPDPGRFLAELAGGGPATEPANGGLTPWPGGFSGPGASSGAAPTADPRLGAGPDTRPGPGSHPYPPGPPVLDPSRAPRGRHARRGPGGRSRARWTAAAAALLLVAGVGAGVISRGSDNQPGGQQIALSAVGPGNAAGNATLRGNQVCVNPTNLAAPSAGHSYEVWLVDPAQSKLLPVGMTSNGQGCWTIPADQVADYNTVEISDEPDDGNPVYSGKSVLRGKYS